MNKKGFTLVELIATISIMSLIIIIAIPSVISLLSKSGDKLDEAVKKQLITSAKTYMKDNSYIDTIQDDVMYCVLVDELSEENFIDQHNNKVTGRIEIKKNNNEIKYTYSSKNDLDGCQDFPDIDINLNDDEISLESNSNPDFNPDSVLGKLVDKYDYTEAVPNFKYKSPIDNSDGTYREKKVSYSSGSLTVGTISLNSNKYNFTLRPYDNNNNTYADDVNKCGKGLEYTEQLNGFNVKAYFGKSYTFDITTGKYTLKDTVQGYGSSVKPLENGYIYTCLNREESCDEMYEIVDYSCRVDIYWNDFATHNGCYREACSITKGYKYSKRNQIDISDSGLYKTHSEDGPIYYFRGKVENNYIKFDNSDVLFQITRFNPDDSIRAISTTPIYNDGTTTTKNISYDGNYDIYKTYYKVIANTSNSYITNLDINYYSTYSVYNTAYLKDDFSSKNITLSNVNEQYPTLDKCFPSDGSSPCNGKYFYYNGNKKIVNTKIIKNYKGKNVYYVYYNQVVATSAGTKYYDDSNLKKELNKWYETKMKINDEYIVSGKFCYDKLEAGFSLNTNVKDTDSWISSDSTQAAMRLDYNLNKVNPSFSCVNSFTSKVGTLTADEVIFAGAVSDSLENLRNCGYYDDEYKYIKNTDFFLYRKNGFLTLTLATESIYLDSCVDSFKGLNGHGGNFIYGFYTDNVDKGYLTFVNKSYPVYPVINIRGDVKVTGSGTKTDPYVIDA